MPRQAGAAKDQRRQIESTANLHDAAENQEREFRVRVGRINELDEERNEEEDRLGVHQADQQGLAEGIVAV